ncbi:MAG: hypothetical protein KAW17_07750 [Candidatus Eisenbacteria sp.]|nr:hypothetical protein [Candidatus Eisenbacteria bacterium]
MRILCLLGVLAMIGGCATGAPVYDIAMENATDAVIQVYEDESIAIRFTPGRDHLAFDLKNKTNGVIEILWDQIIFEDVEGHHHSVLRSGTSYADKDKPQEPTAVPPKKRIQGEIIPKDHISKSEKDPGKWETAPLLLPKGIELIETKSLSNLVVGKNFTVVIPLIVGGQRQSYPFSFKVIGVSGPSGKGPLQRHGDRIDARPTSSGRKVD